MGVRARVLGVLTVLLVAGCAPSGGGPIGLPSTPARTSPAAGTSAPAATTSVPSSVSPSPSASPSPSPSPSASPTAAASPTPTPTATPPRLLLANATQTTLTLAFDAAMQSALPCGSTGTLRGGFQSLDSSDVRSHYHSTDPVLDEALGSIAQATILADCKGVQLQLGLLAAPGTYSIVVSNVADLKGTLIEPATAQVSIANTGRPTVVGAGASGKEITVTFSEPMLEIGEGSGVIMTGNYRLDGVPLVTEPIVCLDRGCRSVRITLATALLAGSSHALRVANVVDRGGLNITPDPATVAFTAH